MSVKKLIINADDFGISSPVNRAVIKGWTEGILTSASLMVAGEAFTEAVDLAKRNPALQVGLHLTLVQGRSALEHGGFPSLTDHLGNFPEDPVFAGMRMFFLKPLRKQLEGEIEAQLVRFLETGLPLSHIDGHLNIHMHPTVFDILCRLMPKYGISSFRLSRENLGAELSASSDRTIGKAVDAFIFSNLAKRCLPELQRRRISFASEVKGLLNSGKITEEYLLKLLGTLNDGTTEIYFHPSESDRRELPGYRMRDELQALLSQKVRDMIRSKEICLCNYRGEVKDV
jgi:hopanoid biosynthesis associated protein HpnK